MSSTIDRRREEIHEKRSKRGKRERERGENRAREGEAGGTRGHCCACFYRWVRLPPDGAWLSSSRNSAVPGCCCCHDCSPEAEKKKTEKKGITASTEGNRGARHQLAQLPHLPYCHFSSRFLSFVAYRVASCKVLTNQCTLTSACSNQERGIHP